MFPDIETSMLPHGSPTPALKFVIGLALASLVTGVPDARATERASAAETQLRYDGCVVDRRERRLAVLRGTANKLYAVPTVVREYRLVCEGVPVTRWLAGDPPTRLAHADAPLPVEIVLP